MLLNRKIIRKEVVKLFYCRKVNYVDCKKKLFVILYFVVFFYDLVGNGKIFFLEVIIGSFLLVFCYIFEFCLG